MNIRTRCNSNGRSEKIGILIADGSENRFHEAAQKAY
jgi:hypothetical protein